MSYTELSNPTRFILGLLLAAAGGGAFNTYIGDWMGWIALAGLAFFTFGEKAMERKALANGPFEGTGGRIHIN